MHVVCNAFVGARDHGADESRSGMHGRLGRFETIATLTRTVTRS
jgi:hypothetical protein